MTVTPDRLLARLEAIGASLATRADALGLLGLGSVGRERQRLDVWSDLDFFVFVQPGAKPRYLDSLEWLAAAHPLAWHFRNTADGHKALMADGVFCEFAVFEPQEIAAIPYAPGRWVWRRDELDAALEVSPRPPPTGGTVDVEWCVGEALSNLIVGLQRLARGETLAAMRMIQVFAVDRALELAEHAQQTEHGVRRDPFARERRIEQRAPALAAALPHWVQGYAATVPSALALLDWLQAQHRVPPAVSAQIRALAAQAAAPSGR